MQDAGVGDHYYMCSKEQNVRLNWSQVKECDIDAAAAMMKQRYSYDGDEQ